MEYSVYINREDAAKAENQELNSFVRAIIDEIGIDVDEIWDEEEELNVNSKAKLRDLLSKYDIEIIHDGDRGYQIYFEDTIVGEWFKPRFILRKDLSARRISQRVYYEMIVKFTSPFESDEDNE